MCKLKLGVQLQGGDSSCQGKSAVFTPMIRLPFGEVWADSLVVNKKYYHL